MRHNNRMDKTFTPIDTKNPQTLLSWSAPLRAYKKRKSGVLRFYIALSLVLSALVFLFGDKILILLIWAVMFLFYILTITPPPIVENKITKFGIDTNGNTIRWDFLSHFYFINKFDYTVLVVVSIAPYYYHLYLVLPNEGVKSQIIQILSEHIVYQENPRKTSTDRVVEWFGKLMPDYEDKVSHSGEENITMKEAHL
jgi:hypothetical protein